MNKRTLYYFLGPKQRRIIRRLYYLPVDLLDKLFGRRDALTPPKGRIFIGSGDFKLQGKKLLKQLTEFGGLKPHHRVLDIGCGIGRLAVPLTNYLDQSGSYEGFDIVKSGVKWCEKNIASKYKNFNFKYIDLRNELYNLDTKIQAKNFTFPYQKEEFDFVFLFSVFTHMLPEDIENYLGEIYNVLKPGGKCLATFFILNKDTRKFMDNNDGLTFDYHFGNYALHNKDVKEANVALEENFLNELIKKNNLNPEKISYGYWSGRNKEECLDFQDIILLSK